MDINGFLDTLFLTEKIALRGSYTGGVFQRLVAAAYVNAPSFDREAAKLYRVLVTKVQRQKKMLGHRYNFQPTDDDPYPSMKAMSKDLDKQKAAGQRKVNVKVFGAEPTGIPEDPDTGEKVYSNDENIDFRSIHDIIAHYFGQHPFSGRGEYSAYNRHIKTLGPQVARVLFSEIVGQTSYYKIYGGFATQKVTFLPDFDPLVVGALAPNSPLNKWFYLENKALKPRPGFRWANFAAALPQWAATLEKQPKFDPSSWETYSEQTDTSLRNPKQKVV